MDKVQLLKKIYASYKEKSQALGRSNSHDAGTGDVQVKYVGKRRPAAARDVVLSAILEKREYRILGKKGEGTFSEVLKCQHIKDGSNWACKKMKQHYESIEQVNNLREIQAMKRLSPHPNILELQEFVFDKKSGVLVLVCELMDMNIYELIRGRRQYLPESKIKSYMYQLCKSLDHMHRNGIFHRDVKPENILIRDDVLKLADFGSCRSIYSKQPYTEYISTRWYRAPECLLTDGFYSYKMDIWSVGCVFFEILSLHPLFPGSNEVDQIAKIHDVLGTPDQNVLNKLKNKTRGINFNFPTKKGTGIEKSLKHCSSHCIELIYQMCTYDPDERITAKQALKHPYFKELREADKRTVAMSKVSSLETVDINNNNNNSNKLNSDTKVTKTDNHDSRVTEVSAIVKPLHHHHHRDKRKKRHRHKISEAHTNPMLPKVPAGHTTSFHSTYTASFPKIGGTTSTVLPSITNTYKPKTKASQASKNVFGHYQLPSIDRRGAGY